MESHHESESVFSTLAIEEKQEEVLPLFEFTKYEQSQSTPIIVESIKEVEPIFVDTVNEDEVEEVLPFLEFIKEGEINRILYAFLHFMEINELQPEMFDDNLDFSTLTIDDEVEEILPFLEYVRGDYKGIEMSESEYSTLTVNDEAEEILPFLEYVKCNKNEIVTLESEFLSLETEEELDDISPFFKFVQSKQDNFQTKLSFLEPEYESENVFACAELLSCSR